jgi:hypothetical protein
MIAVPAGTQLPTRPGCESSVLGELGQRAREWWQSVVR